MNHGERIIGAREWLRLPAFRAGFLEVWRGDPPDYDARPSPAEAGRYEMGRQMAIWLKAERLASTNRVPSARLIPRMAEETGLPKVLGVNR
jgi:hypothetical protein